jgi:hypothetical protein
MCALADVRTVVSLIILHTKTADSDCNQSNK